MADSQDDIHLAQCIQTLKAKGKTVIIVTHKTGLLALSDKVLMLVDGAVEKFGPTKEVFQPKPPAQAQPQPATEQPKVATSQAPSSVLKLNTTPSS